MRSTDLRPAVTHEQCPSGFFKGRLDAAGARLHDTVFQKEQLLRRIAESIRHDPVITNLLQKIEAEFSSGSLEDPDLLDLHVLYEQLEERLPYFPEITAYNRLIERHRRKKSVLKRQEFEARSGAYKLN